ncbi:MAG TPA: LysR substrate-binding domain-containing protein [Tabrizicola sp.]|nr:LysR substrate-binding domain-containing protein [Tabrizicola sp.]
MRDLDTGLLRTFVVLAETLSFGRTGARVGRSQSAVSGQIARLEEVLGVRLLARDTRNVALTAEGEQALGVARAILAEADALIERFRGGQVAGEVRFGSPEDFASAYLPGLLADFTSAHPEVELHVTCQLTLPLYEDWQTGGLDVIVVKQDPRRPFPGSEPLWREPVVWAAREGFAWRGPVPLVLSPAPCVYRARATAALDARGKSWTVAFTSPSFAGAVAAVRAGLGVMPLPEGMRPDGLGDVPGLPAMAEAELALLVRPKAGVAARALAAFVAGRVRR